MVDNPVFSPDDFASGGHSGGMENHNKHRSSSQRMSPYFFHPGGSHSSAGSHSPPVSLHNFYHAPAPNYYYHPHTAPDYVVPPSAMWHRNPRYQEDELPNMAASHYPRIQVGPNPQVQMANRRYSLASVNSANYAQPPPQRRRISVTKYQNIPPGNYLQVPAFHDYDHKPNYVSSKSTVHHLVDAPREYQDYLGHTTPPSASRDGAHAAPVHSRKTSASGCIPKSSSNSRRSKSQSREPSRSQSPADDRSKTPPRSSRSRSPSIERMNTPDPSSLPVPAFEFTSNHLPLRPPTININKYSSGSGSMSTPESQRIESRQMIRPSSSKAAPYSPKVTVRREGRKDGGSTFGATSPGHSGDRSIFSITKPAQWCRHTDEKTCQNCNSKADALSVCSSVNPPPTFTALDNYQPVRKRGRCSCTCSTIFSISVMLAVLVMLFITAFILYVEMVLKHQTANVMDKM